jgi:hypothetical protein
MFITSTLKAIPKALFKLSTVGMDTGVHMVRYRMYESISEVLSAIQASSRTTTRMKALSISGSQFLTRERLIKCR